MMSYSDAKIYIEAEQRNALISLYGLNFEKAFNSKHNDQDIIFDGYEKHLAKKGYSEDIRYEIEALMKNVHFNDSGLFTQYDYRPHRQILEWIYSVYKELNETITDDEIPYLGTTVSKDANARIFKPSGLDKPIILYSGGQLTENFLLSKIFALSIPTRFKDGVDSFFIDSKIESIKDHILTNSSSAFKLILIDFFDHLLNGNPSGCFTGIITDEFFESMVACLLESISLFIFSHEIGHYINDHPLDEISVTNKRLKEQELDCDLHGLNQVAKLWHLRGKNYFILIAPAVFLYFQSIKETFNKQLALDETHPSASERITIYTTLIFNFLDETESEHLDAYLELTNNIFTAYQLCLPNYSEI